MKDKKTISTRRREGVGRQDHEVVKFHGQLIPVLGTVGGTKEESEQTAKNIERYFSNLPDAGAAMAYQDISDRLTTGKLPTYSIAPDGKSITCRICGMTSYHPEDVRNKYCGRCHKFHEGHDAFV